MWGDHAYNDGDRKARQCVKEAMNMRTMTDLVRRRLRRGLAIACWISLCASPVLAGNWRDLTGRVAPDLTFSDTAQGIEPGTKLSSYRNKQVVLLVFWLRDCPRCKRELPKVERLHETYRDAGLQVISVVHGFPLSEVLPHMEKRGWSFPVARDEKGQLAHRYGGGRRPAFYVIGIDGRVRASNALNERAIATELGKWRVNELGSMPVDLKAAQAQVRAGRYGAALRVGEAVAKRPDASAEVQAAVERLRAVAGAKLNTRVERARAWAAAGHAGRARQEYRDIVAAFQGTSLESRARALQDLFLRKEKGGG